MGKSRKLMNLIALVVFLSSNILTPLSYASAEFDEVVEPQQEEQEQGEILDTQEPEEDKGDIEKQETEELTAEPEDNEKTQEPKNDEDDKGDIEKQETEEPIAEPEDNEKTEEPTAGPKEDEKTQEPQNNENGEKEEEKGAVEEIIDKILYFFRAETDKKIDYSTDENKIETITLTDPENGSSITIMANNLTNKDGDDAFGYDSVNFDGNDDKELVSCPEGYHIPTADEWTDLVNTWGKIHTQDTVIFTYTDEKGEEQEEKSDIVRYGSNESVKSSLEKCGEGDTECIEEENLEKELKNLLLDELNLGYVGGKAGIGGYWSSSFKKDSAISFSLDSFVSKGLDEVEISDFFGG